MRPKAAAGRAHARTWDTARSQAHARVAPTRCAVAMLPTAAIILSLLLLGKRSFYFSAEVLRTTRVQMRWALPVMFTGVRRFGRCARRRAGTSCFGWTGDRGVPGGHGVAPRQRRSPPFNSVVCYSQVTRSAHDSRPNDGDDVLIGPRRFLIGRGEETSGQKERQKTGKRVIFRDRGRRPASSLAFRVSNGNQSEEKRQNTNWSRRASIPLPSACKADALPSELLPLLGSNRTGE